MAARRVRPLAQDALSSMIRMSLPGAHTPPKRRMHVVTLIDNLKRGGAEHIAEWLAAGFDSTRIHSTLVTSRAAMPGKPADSALQALERLRTKGIRVLELDRRHKLEVNPWRRLLRFLRENRTDVLHAHKFGSNVWASMLGHAAGVPVVIAHEHSWASGGSLPRRLIDRHVIAPRVDRLIAVSREDQRRMVEIERIDRTKTLLVPNGIPAVAPTPGRDVRAELGIPAGAPVIGIVGSLTRVKAVDVLIRATAELVAHHGELRVLVVGDGPERAALEHLVSSLELKHAVRLLGARADVHDVLAAVNLGVCCSDSEGSPLSVMEHMQRGLPVVASAVGGIPDLIEDGVHGLLVPPRNPQALASALDTLLSNPAQMRAMGRRAQERQQADYSLDILLERLEALYIELLADRDPAPQAACPERAATNEAAPFNA